VITIAAAEVGLGLAIVLMVFRTRGTSDLDDLGLLNERAETERLAEFDGDGPQPDLRSDAGSPDVTEPEAAR
jgi:NADH-quinone oxidoreductase subunit K